MRKTLFLAALVLISAGCFAQKANVKKAKNLCLQEEPDFAAARQAIGEALQNEETKDDANTWYVAGLIGYTENDFLNRAQAIGQTVDEQKKGQAVVESYDYFLVADQLAMTPKLDKKGKEVVDLKTRKNVIAKLSEYYDDRHQDLIKYGIYLNDQRDYRDAYEVFMRHLRMPDLPMMQDEKQQAKMPKDTIYYQYYYYAGLFATQAEMHPEAVAVFSAIKDGLYEPAACNQFLYQEYLAMGDTVKGIQVLKDAIQKFPGESWFLQNLINYYVNSGNMDAALNYLDQAIAADPQAQYFISKGSILSLQKRFDEAVATYEQALKIAPNDPAIYENYGFVFTEKGNMLNDEAAYLPAKEYEKAKVAIDRAFQQALPYFEKAYQLAPDNADYKRALRSLYYRLGDEAKYQQLAD